MIPSDNVLVTLDTQGPNAINVQASTLNQVVFVKVSEIFLGSSFTIDNYWMFYWLYLACNCNAIGASGFACNSAGQCACNTGYTGTKCSLCASSYYASGGMCQGK